MPAARRALDAVPISTATGTDPLPLPTPTRLGVLRHRQFALLFTGQAMSSIGDRIFMVAMPFAVLSVPGADAGDVGLTLGASALALALCVLVGGVVADRLPRQLTMLTSDVVRAAAQAVGAGLLLSGNASVWSLAALMLVYGAAEAFFRPAMLGLVPQVVEPGEEQPANALVALTQNVSMVGAPALAGVLVAWLGPGGSLAVDAGTFVVSALSLLALRPRPVPRAPAASLLADLAGGFREVRTRAWVWTTLLAFSAYHALMLPALFVLGPLVAVEIRDGASSWGWISSGFGAGAVVGSLLALRYRPSRPGVFVGASLSIASAQAAICASSLPTWSVTALEAVTGLGVAMCFTVWETLLQQHIPASAQSRVSSFDYLGSLTLMPLGFVVVGPAAAAFGVRPTAVAASVLTAVVCLQVASERGLRELRPAQSCPSSSSSVRQPPGGTATRTTYVSWPDGVGGPPSIVMTCHPSCRQPAHTRSASARSAIRVMVRCCHSPGVRWARRLRGDTPRCCLLGGARKPPIAGLYPNGASREERAVDLGDRGHTCQAHDQGQVVGECAQARLHAGRPVGREGPQDRLADEHRGSTTCQGAQDVEAAADPAVDQHGDVHGRGHLREGSRCRHGAAQLPAAVVAHDDPGRSGGHALAGVVGAEHPFDQHGQPGRGGQPPDVVEGGVGCLVQPAERSPASGTEVRRVPGQHQGGGTGVPGPQHVLEGQAAVPQHVDLPPPVSLEGPGGAHRPHHERPGRSGTRCRRGLGVRVQPVVERGRADEDR
jgi:MFS family permease